MWGLGGGTSWDRSHHAGEPPAQQGFQVATAVSVVVLQFVAPRGSRLGVIYGWLRAGSA